MAEYSVVGKRIPRVDGVEKVTGKAVYGVDVKLPKMLFGKILRSKAPHARILNIDISRAKKLAGVKAVITAKDTPRIKTGFIKFASAKFGDCLPLKDDKVRYMGDEVAAVAAVDEDAAEEALELIEVEYEELPAVYDPFKAMEPGAPVIHDHVQNNIAVAINLEVGDLESALRHSGRVFEHRFETQGQAHCCLEPHQSVVHYEPSGRYTIWSSTQMPFLLRHDLADALGVPESMVRVIQTYIGGGFGSRMEMHTLDPICAFLARETGRPVKIVYDRYEEFRATRIRHPMVFDISTGVKDDGTLLARHIKVVADCGAYVSQAPGVLAVAGFMGMSLYRVPNIKFESKAVYTNNPYGGAFRGYGNPQVTFAVESQLDIIAEQLGIDPAELRLKNANKPNTVTPLKQVITSCGHTESVVEAARLIDWGGKRGKRPGKGLGMACLLHCAGGARFHGNTDGCGAIIKMEDDATITLITGAGDIGQGGATVQAQIAAEELGISVSDIRVVSGDTDLTPWDVGIHASRGTFVSGNAVRMAARQIREKLLRIGSEKLEACAEDLEIAKGAIRVIGSPGKFVTLAEAARSSHYREKGETLQASAFYDPPTQLQRRSGGNSSAAYSFGTQAADVEVDIETGIVRVLNLAAVHDIGYAINPMGAEGQIEGGATQGIGYGLMEELIFSHGTVSNDSLMDYKVPTALDVPRIKAAFVITSDPEGPYGAKGIAEPALVPTAPAIANAIYEATGARVTSLPITAEKIMKAIKGRPSAKPL